MKQRKSYEKDAHTIVIESLSTTSSDTDEEEQGGREAPFSRHQNHVSIISEIEKRLNQFSKKVISPNPGEGGIPSQNALVLYRSPESMGLPALERGTSIEEMKAEARKRAIKRRRNSVVELDGYEADADDDRKTSITNGRSNEMTNMSDDDDDDDDDDVDMMDLD